MLSGYFQNPELLMGLGLVALPILIHLLNRFRYRRVRWAAIDFLLESQQRNRRRIFLEQLFLLGLRCLLVALAVLLVARPSIGERFAALLAGQETEHVVVLDDSLSMGERQGETTAFASGTGAIRRLCRTLAERPGQHKLSLRRTSRFDTPELESTRVDRTLSATIETLLGDWQPTFGTAGPGVLEAAAQRAVPDGTGSRSLYLISDFRRRDWVSSSGGSPESTTAGVDPIGPLRRLATEGVQLYLVDAAAEGSPGNLTVENATAELGTAAVGIPFPLVATVRNHTGRPVEPVTVTARVDGRPLPVRQLDRVEPGGSGKVEFELALDQPGVHEVSVELPVDSLAGDNRRFVAVDLPERIEALIVDGGRDRTDSQYLALALAPGGSVRTGLLPVVRGPDALTAGMSLRSYRAVFLLNLPRLEPELVRALIDYVEDGGGLAVFLGDQIDAAQYNAALCHPETGLFRAPLQAPWEAPAGVALGPDLRPERHPIFRVFEGERNPFLETVRVLKMFRLRTEAGDGTNVIAWWRGGWPLVLESRRDRGRALLVLTTAGPDWNTWARNPSFVVAMLELARYLCEPAVRAQEKRIGEPWEIELPAGYRRTATVRGPAADGSKATDTLEATTVGVGQRLRFARTALPGVYELHATRADGAVETTVMAANVDPGEGDLGRVDRAELEQSLHGIDYRYLRADELGEVEQAGGVDPRDWLILAIVFILAFEQYWAYRLGYHAR